MQLRLKELGYYNSSITDYFGTVTQAAVKAFQNNNGLTADGVVGKLTWTKLFADPNARPASATPTPKPTPAPAKYYITIDVVNQIVTVYGQNSRGEHTEVIKRMICSTGTSSHPTPERQYVLNGATARWCYFPAWGTHAQYWTRISSSIAFHSVIYTTPNTMALSTSSYFNLGSPASHGCIRLLVADAKWIYDNCGAGTVVDVIRGKPDPEGTQALKPPALNYNNMLPQATPAPTPTPKYDANALPPQPFRTLEVGSKGEDVFWLQCRLTELGYYTGSITGGYANGTRDAVKAYQKDHGLSQDGKAGRLTQNSIYEYVLYPTPSPTPFTTPTPSPTPFTTPVPVIPPQNPMAAPTPTPVG
ncbi:MAG: peptidoglycan-binding protein [Oscillospiraceae bacterium]|nr:peptidoglycan-binding protein [Oscillospiraceae bacterium]